MSDCMEFPKDWEKFIEDYSFEDKEEVYTNGSMLIPVFRVEQIIEHYFGRGWIPVTERLPENFISVLGYMPDAVPFPPVRECYTVGNEFYFPALHEVHVVTHWMPLPERPRR